MSLLAWSSPKLTRRCEVELEMPPKLSSTPCLQIQQMLRSALPSNHGPLQPMDLPVELSIWKGPSSVLSSPKQRTCTKDVLETYRQSQADELRWDLQQASRQLPCTILRLLEIEHIPPSTPPVPWPHHCPVRKARHQPRKELEPSQLSHGGKRCARLSSQSHLQGMDRRHARSTHEQHMLRLPTSNLQLRPTATCRHLAKSC
mmetsp:Transcript_102442/g.256676  ORF Transcript_102442/g.256676 Transcript_102442/m.256676 type:complete len:202 (+) Transcript_102442:195-800(+)